MLPKRPEIITITDHRKTSYTKVMSYYNQGDTEGGLKEFLRYVAGPESWEKTSKDRLKTLRANKWTQISLLQDIDTPYRCNNAGNITAPVLLVTGDHSPPLNGHMNSALHNCLKQVSGVIIADAGHMMFYANPTAFIFEVQDFISVQ